MKNDFCNHYPYIPCYPDESDYTTNAPSYYDDLARKNHLLKILAKKIYDYDKELAKRFEEWDKNLIDFPEDVKNLLIKWLDDGTLAKIINDEVLNMKADKTYVDLLKNDLEQLRFDLENLTIETIQTSEKEPTNQEVMYWFEKKK